jgi:hypothetical protein
MTDKTYNGWANYATWRVNLEIFDGMSARDVTGRSLPTVSDLRAALQEHAEMLICDYKSETSLAQDYALAFLADVEWYEIANHMLADEETEDDATEDEDTEEEA